MGIGNVYIEYWLIRDGIININDFYCGMKFIMVIYFNGFLIVQGDNFIYSLGDYVWLDKNKNGV